MKLGIKVGTKNDPYKDIDATHPDFCEVWFHSGRIDEYHNLIKYIRRSGSEAGLHFWGRLSDGTLANLAYPDADVLKTSRELVERTIDTAAKYKLWYVNIHPGGAKLVSVNSEINTWTPKTPRNTESKIIKKIRAICKRSNVLVYLKIYFR